MRNHTYKGRSFTCWVAFCCVSNISWEINRNKVSTSEQPCTTPRRQIFILSILPCVRICLHCSNLHLIINIIIIINIVFVIVVIIIIIIKSQLFDELHITERCELLNSEDLFSDYKSWSFAVAELQNSLSWLRWFRFFLSKPSNLKTSCQLQTTALQKTYTTPQNLHSAHVTGGAGLRARGQMVNTVSIQTGFNRISLRLQYVSALTVIDMSCLFHQHHQSLWNLTLKSLLGTSQ